MKHNRQFTLFQQIPIIYKASLSFLFLKIFKKKNGMNFKLKERIMLAVTEVNGCAMCSYVHIKLATKAGLSDKDIKEILAGELEGIPEAEAKAVLFGKNYAFNHEVVDQEFYTRLVETYGIRKARSILGVTHVITMTNGMGISLDLLKQTLTFKHVKGSNILNELLVPVFTMVLFPLFLLLNLFVVPFVKLKHR
ncbi:carboxymuconolactone decarboxylase family protein [Liberiplasma polymorphum]|uniref:carboxymuconolactone decarboxylase family protein n=1 Tax=Liberiplasma polymorphum TaxID=3374570 RepID=UPI00377328C9